MKRASFVLIGLIIVVVIGVALWLPRAEIAPVRNNISSPSTETSKEISYKCEKEKTAFDVLIEKYPDTKFESSSFGKLVTSIDGKMQGNNKYWLYSINNKEATIGASSYICQDQETIKWELK